MILLLVYEDSGGVELGTRTSWRLPRTTPMGMLRTSRIVGINSEGLEVNPANPGIPAEAAQVA